MGINTVSIVVTFFLFCFMLDSGQAQRFGSSVKDATLNRAPAPPPNDCSECWCQCKRLSFRDSYGRIHGNCARFFHIYIKSIYFTAHILPFYSFNYFQSKIFYFSSYNGAQWCYVENNIGYGYSTCEDQRRSVKFSGSTWSYHACTTPALYSSSCRYCQGRRSSSNSGSRNRIDSQRPTIRGADPNAEGVDTRKNEPKTTRPSRYQYQRKSTRPSRYQYQRKSSKYQYRGRL